MVKTILNLYILVIVQYPMSIKLSVVIITFNEEDNIKRCLESIQKVADEIIVVDSFSSDKTEVIMKTVSYLLLIVFAFSG